MNRKYMYFITLNKIKIKAANNELSLQNTGIPDFHSETSLGTIVFTNIRVLHQLKYTSSL